MKQDESTGKTAPNSRPKRPLKHFISDMRKEGVEAVSATEVIEAISVLYAMTPEAIRDLADGLKPKPARPGTMTEYPFILCSLARMLLSTRDMPVLFEFLERKLGKATPEKKYR
jgi:hypothetical protein